jgi:hypothetical protein
MIGKKGLEDFFANSIQPVAPLEESPCIRQKSAQLELSSNPSRKLNLDRLNTTPTEGTPKSSKTVSTGKFFDAFSALFKSCLLWDVRQGCQMGYFQIFKPKNTNLGKFWSVLP